MEFIYEGIQKTDSQKAFHGDKSPLYQQITHFSFQFMENDLFGSPSTGPGDFSSGRMWGKKAQSNFLRDHKKIAY